MQIEQLINWRQVSKIVSDSGSETAIRMHSCPKKYYEPIDALLEALQQWHRQYMDKKPVEAKLTVKEIKDKLNTIQWD